MRAFLDMHTAYVRAVDATFPRPVDGVVRYNHADLERITNFRDRYGIYLAEFGAYVIMYSDLEALPDRTVNNILAAIYNGVFRLYTRACARLGIHFVMLDMQRIRFECVAPDPAAPPATEKEEVVEK